MHVLRGCCLATKVWEEQWSSRVWFCGCVLLNFIVWNCLIDWSSWLERCWVAVGFFWPQQRNRLGVGRQGNQVWTWWSRKSLCFSLSTYSPLHVPAFAGFLVCSYILWRLVMSFVGSLLSSVLYVSTSEYRGERSGFVCMVETALYCLWHSTQKLEVLGDGFCVNRSVRRRKKRFKKIWLRYEEKIITPP